MLDLQHHQIIMHNGDVGGVTSVATLANDEHAYVLTLYDKETPNGIHGIEDVVRREIEMVNPFDTFSLVFTNADSIDAVISGLNHLKSLIRDNDKA